MLDVHPLHKRFHGVGEFLLHLVAITIGLLIAVGIEGFVERRHHAHLAEEAHNALHNEIAGNLKLLRNEQLRQKHWKGLVQDDIATLRRIIDHPNDAVAQSSFTMVDCSTIGDALNSTAWKTAQSTSALDFMPYEEASTYVNIYQAQDRLIASETRPCDDVAEIFGILSQYRTGVDWKHSKIEKDSRITQEEAAAILNKLGEMTIHLAVNGINLDESTEFNAAFLEDRNPRSDFSGDIE